MATRDPSVAQCSASSKPGKLANCPTEPTRDRSPSYGVAAISSPVVSLNRATSSTTGWLADVMAVPSPVTTSLKPSSAAFTGVYSSTSGSSSVSPVTVMRSITSGFDTSGREQSDRGEPGSEHPARPTVTSPRTTRAAGILRTGLV